MSSAMRILFVSLLVSCQPVGVRQLWNEFHLPEEYGTQERLSTIVATYKLLHDLRALVEHHKKKIFDFDLPSISEEFEALQSIPKVIVDEFPIPILEDDVNSISKFNYVQYTTYEAIMESVERNENKIFFIDGPGGFGKTFLYKTLLANVRRRGHIVLAIASSEIAVNNLPGGRTAHSRFKIPLKLHSKSSCNIKKQDDLVELMLRAKLIIWDEEPMTHKYALWALDKTLRDIAGKSKPFGGNIMVLGGDFRQLLPVVRRGTINQQIGASVTKSTFWSCNDKLRLSQNMRSLGDSQFSDYLLRVGDGTKPVIEEDFIKLPTKVNISWVNEASIKYLIEEVFPNMEEYLYDSSYMVRKAIITPKNVNVDKLNEIISHMFLGTEKE